MTRAEAARRRALAAINDQRKRAQRQRLALRRFGLWPAPEPAWLHEPVREGERFVILGGPGGGAIERRAPGVIAFDRSGRPHGPYATMRDAWFQILISNARLGEPGARVRRRGDRSAP